MMISVSTQTWKNIGLYNQQIHWKLIKIWLKYEQITCLWLDVWLNSMRGINQQIKSTKIHLNSSFLYSLWSWKNYWMLITHIKTWWTEKFVMLALRRWKWFWQGVANKNVKSFQSKEEPPWNFIAVLWEKSSSNFPHFNCYSL